MKTAQRERGAGVGEPSKDIGRQRFLNNLGCSRNKKVVTVAGTCGWKRWRMDDMAVERQAGEMMSTMVRMATGSH